MRNNHIVLPLLYGLFDDKGYFPGSRIAPRSIPASRLSIAALDEIAQTLGDVSGGTFYAGTIGAGRVILGDLVGGAVWRDAQERTTASITMDGAMRLGLLDTPGIDMTAGVLDLHGGAIRAGSVTATKLALPGALSSVLLNSDRIQVGTGTWGVNFNGMAITSSAMGGWKNGASIWAVDNATGAIVFTDSATPTTDYAKLNEDGLTVATSQTLMTTTPESAIRFTSPATSKEAGLYCLGNVFVMSNLNATTTEPLLALFDKNSYAVTTWLGGGYLHLLKVDSGYTCYLGERSTGNQDTDLCTYGELRLGPEKYDSNVPAMISIDDATLNLYGCAIRWKNFTGGVHNRSWAARPTWDATERGLWMNNEDNVLEMWTGTEWKILAFTA